MAQTFQQLQKQIEALQLQAEELRRSEVQEIIARIKTAINAYGLTAQDLFGSGGQRAVNKQVRARRAPTSAKYSDGHGNTWAGMGKRPRWLQEALAAGGKLEDFLGQPGSEPAGSAAATAVQRRGKTSAQGKGDAKYRDGDGNVWSGRGPRPRWLKDALAAGKVLEDLRS